MSKPTVKVGDIYDSKHYGKVEIIKYHGWYNVEIKFLNTNTTSVVHMCAVKCGSVRDPSSKASSEKKKLEIIRLHNLKVNPTAISRITLLPRQAIVSVLKKEGLLD